MKKLYILKIGGSVATYKNRSSLRIRRNKLNKIALEINNFLKSNNINLIIIHGSGSAGHLLVNDYDLKNGTNNDSKKIKGALLLRMAHQKQTTEIANIFLSTGLQITPIHTSSVIFQTNKNLKKFDLTVIKESLNQNYVPLLYGDMVFDDKIGMSICSGDFIAPYLTEKLQAEKLFFASDIDGIYTSDPYKNKDAKLIEEIHFKDIIKKAKITNSHNIDATGGLLGKISKLKNLKNKKTLSIEIFNGLKEENYKNILYGKNMPKHTKIIF